MIAALDIVVIGLSLSSSWGNGHATTYRALLRGLAALGHRVTFLERDVPWYAANRDLAAPDFCALHLYGSVDDLMGRHGGAIERADLVLVGSYVPDGAAVIDAVAARHQGKGLAFYDIDTPLTLAKLARGDEDYLARRQIPRFDRYFSFTGGPTLRRLEREFGARRAVMLPCAVDADVYHPLHLPKRWDLGYLGTYSADRQPALEQLLLEPARRRPQRRFVVAGPQYPASIAWPENVERIAHLAPADHPAFYAAQRFTLNLTRADMAAAGWSPSVRLFEAAACATPVVSDPWPGLSDFFPEGEAILVARSAHDIETILAAPPALAAGVAAEAHALTLRHHTGTARAAELVAAWRAVSSRRGETSRNSNELLAMRRVEP